MLFSAQIKSLRERVRLAGEPGRRLPTLHRPGGDQAGPLHPCGLEPRILIEDRAL